MNEKHTELTDWLRTINNNVVAVAQLIKMGNNGELKISEGNVSTDNKNQLLYENNQLKSENNRLRHENNRLMEKIKAYERKI
jgi:FtsZ-binding cell division protein ZapB